MLNKRSFLAILGAVIITTACVSPKQKVQGAGLVSKGYQITDVNVVLAKDAAVGRFKKDPALTRKALQSIDDVLSAHLEKSSGGSKKAKLNVEITRMELRSAGGRTLIAIENQIVANVVARDTMGQVLAARQIFFAQKGTRNEAVYNGIPVGLLISAAINAGKSGSGNDIKKVIDGFNSKVLIWAGE